MSYFKDVVKYSLTLISILVVIIIGVVIYICNN